jgi:hypothetical protein
MAPIKIADRVKEYTATEGTGDVVLQGSPPGFVTFLSAIGIGNRTYYCIAHEEANEFEIGVGYISAADVFVRETVWVSSNFGGLVNFVAGVKRIFVTNPARAALLYPPDGSPLFISGSVEIGGDTIIDHNLYVSGSASFGHPIDSASFAFTSSVSYNSYTSSISYYSYTASYLSGAAAGGAPNTASIQFPFGNGQVMGIAGDFLMVVPGFNFVIKKWIARTLDSAKTAIITSASFAVEKVAWNGGARTDMIGAGTQPVMSASAASGSTANWTDVSGSMGDAIIVSLASLNNSPNVRAMVFSLQVTQIPG